MEPPRVKNDILMFHRPMQAMPLDHEMSVGDICRAIQNAGGPVVDEWDLAIRRALVRDENAFFKHPPVTSGGA